MLQYSHIRPFRETKERYVSLLYDYHITKCFNFNQKLYKAAATAL